MEIPKEISDMSDEVLDEAINKKYGHEATINELPGNDPLVMELLKRIETGE